MSLSNCPECGHDVSTSAVACPSCGRPLQYNTPVQPRPIIVQEAIKEEEGVPPWAFAVGGIALIGLIVLAFVMFSRSDDSANSNLSVRVGSDGTSRPATRERTSSEPSTVTVPATSSEPVSVPESRTNVPGSQTDVTAPPTKGQVKIDAKVVSQSGSPQAVRNEKFYLLERSVEDILSEARIEPIEGNSLTNSLGLAVMFPERYGDFRQKAMQAINSSVEYSGTTGSDGMASLGGIEPGSYYLFGITKTGKGFAIWSSQVSINAGDNVLNLSPARVTEITGVSE